MAAHTARAAAASPLRLVVPAPTLRTAVDALRALVDECRMTFDEDGLRVDAMDPATVASVSLELAPAAFETYDVDGRTLGVPLERLDDVLSVAGREDTVALAFDPETRRLDVAAGGVDYAMALLDPESVRSPPDLEAMAFEFTASATVGADALSRAVRAADMVSDHATVGVDDGGETGALVVAAEGDTDDVVTRLDGEELAALSPGAAESLYSVDYLRALDRAVPTGASVDLRLGDEVPLSLSFDVADGSGRVEYALSPRIAR